MPRTFGVSGIPIAMGLADIPDEFCAFNGWCVRHATTHESLTLKYT